MSLFRCSSAPSITVLPELAKAGTTITIESRTGNIDLRYIKHPDNVRIEIYPGEPERPAKWTVQRMDNKAITYRIFDHED